jgi:hypothetical protein
MDPEQQLTFDAEGYVRMEDLPDVDPDAALAPGELARLHDALIGEQPPDSLLASWDAVVESVDELAPGDLADIVPNEPASTPGPINLVDDGDQPVPAHTAERPAIGEPDASQTPDADGSPTVPLEPEGSSAFAEQVTEPSLDDDRTFEVLDEPSLSMPDDDAQLQVDDLDVDTIEIEHDGDDDTLF